MAARLAALKEGIVDAIVVAPPIDYEGRKLGFNVLVRAGDIFTFPYNGLGTNMRKIKERPDQVKRAIRALIKAKTTTSARIAMARYVKQVERNW